ncbi:hypothetical protein KUU78_31130 (plasmid) [Pseudomonas aeruginosa]|uniref:Uncharacterized protein n=1 Tax=Burkholderia orbicola TaxID=2978683 RepID=A0ABT8P1J2_9BURK|nr:MULTISPECIES: hypothetical protein [Pseudomonadota]MBY9629187.1 hypothetical protein [Pseudomonas aeruginosa]MCO8627554.1 hypothetical protein [Burkholderia multivorans]MDN7527713.1 hypothetical protein [Burkholderia orbicola]NYS16937.1 hypothetical protein [Achromobacter xylosoxidans]QZV39670.1 hypothetical protein KUU78_31130 [Pseudomonas aeruginosa]
MNRLLLKEMYLFLCRLSRVGKAGVVFVLFLAVVSSVVLHTKGLNMDDSIAQWTTTPLIVMAAMAVLAELASSMMHVHLRQTADRG